LTKKKKAKDNVYWNLKQNMIYFKRSILYLNLIYIT